MSRVAGIGVFMLVFGLAVLAFGLSPVWLDGQPFEYNFDPTSNLFPMTLSTLIGGTLCAAGVILAAIGAASTERDEFDVRDRGGRGTY